MFAFSNKNVRFLLSFSVCHCRPFSVDFLDLGVSQDSLNLKMEFKRGEYGVIGVEGPQTDKTLAAKSLYRSICLGNDICHCILSV